MDVIAAAQLAGDVAGLFLDIVKATKELIETMQGARDALVELLSRSERVRLNLELFRSLAGQLVDKDQKSMTISFNDSAYSTTGSEVLTLVRKVADSSKHSDLWMKFNWVFYKSDVEALVKKLEAREQDLNLVLTFIAARSSVITEREILAMKARTEEGGNVTSPFTHSGSLSGHSSHHKHHSAHAKDKGSSPSHFKVISPSPPQAVSWLGYLVRDGLDHSYVKERGRLSDAAYWGKWDPLFSAVKTGSSRFNEDWCNAVTLGTTEQTKKLSLWTPLHQAAYNNAPKTVIETLIQLGAFRTLPTRRTRGEFSHHDLSAVEIARELGYKHLYELLTPVIRHYVAPRTLGQLESKFHDLLRKELGHTDVLKDIRLPVLTVLTELDYPEMWFPIQPLKMGFLFRFDDRDLLVLSVGRPGEVSKQLFRVTTHKWTAIHDAVVMGK